MTISAIKKTINTPIKSTLNRAVSSTPNCKVTKTADKLNNELIDHNAGFIRVDKSLTPDFLKNY